jgi:NTE family protein
MPVETQGIPRREALLTQQLQALFGAAAPGAVEFVLRHIRWVELAGGALLMEQGEAGDSVYLAISGRLRVYVRDEEGASRMVRELTRGDVIGEMSLYTGEPRSATVVAVRDTVLARLDKPDFERLLALGPQVSLTLTRQIIRRLQTERQRRPLPPPVTIGLMPVSEGVDPGSFARGLAEQLARHGRVCIVDAPAIARRLGNAQLVQREDPAEERAVSAELDTLEAEHDFVLLVSDGAAGAWTQRCIRHADEVLLIADTIAAPAVHELERRCLAGQAARGEAAEILVLLQPSDCSIPRGTRRWLARRPVTAHVHVRRGQQRDLARLARLLSRRAVGLVFAGGGARGFAHLGVWQALHERGIEIDCVGGTSVGAVMAALVAGDPPVKHGIAVARKAFHANPTGDFNLLPLVSLIKGRRVAAAIEQTLGDLLGGAVDIEDLWKTYYCVTTNYTQAQQQVLQAGDLGRALRASTAIPGALPPMIQDGELLCDGGTFNNFPVDVMRDLRGVGTVIGVDLGARSGRRFEFDEVPGSWTLLLDRLRPWSKRRYRLPSLTSYLLNMTILYSLSRQQQARRDCNIYLNPPLQRVGLLQWARFDSIVRDGHAHAVAVLQGLDRQQRAALGLDAAAETGPPT